MKKADMIKVLQAMADDAWDVAELFEHDGDGEMAARFRGEFFGLHDAILVLTKPSYAEAMYKGYFNREGTDNA